MCLPGLCVCAACEIFALLFRGRGCAADAAGPASAPEQQTVPLAVKCAAQRSNKNDGRAVVGCCAISLESGVPTTASQRGRPHREPQSLRPGSGVRELLLRRKTGRPRRQQTSVGRRTAAVHAPTGSDVTQTREGHWQPRTPVASAWCWWWGPPARCARSLRLGAERASPSPRLPLDGDEALQAPHLPPGNARALGPRFD